MIYTVKGFGVISEAEVDVSLEFSCFFNDLADVGNLVSGSSAFSKTALGVLWNDAKAETPVLWPPHVKS